MPKPSAWFEGRKRGSSEYERALVAPGAGTWTLDNTRLTNVSWENFSDPVEPDYRALLDLQDNAERELGATLDLARNAGFLDAFDPQWRSEMAVLAGGLSFAEWGVARAMQHVVQLCPVTGVAQAAEFQACDELRHAQRALEWADSLSGAEVTDDEPARAIWMEHPALQPLRRMLEQALELTDWGEVIVAVNVCLEGLLQPFQRELYRSASQPQGDVGTAMLGQHCWADEDRHLGWTEAFLHLVIGSDATNRAVVSGWYETHAPAADG
ncbi:MAG: hypothetical protein LC792_20475, partial [Actinobacteria bacterium]|nr:hypothetical protein [Actinomycetota bacterium]